MPSCSRSLLTVASEPKSTSFLCRPRRRSSRFADAPEGTVRPAQVADDAIRRVLRVPPELAGMRLDVFVRMQLRNTSRTRARAIVNNSAFSPEGRPLRHNDRVQPEQYVVLWRPALEEESDPTGIPILFEDQWLLVVDKPPLLTVHPTARYYQNTLVKRLEAQRPGEYFSLIHRLDRETSGLLLLARSPEADRVFKRLLEDRSVRELVESHAAFLTNLKPSERRAFEARAANAPSIEKTYLAITWGVPPEGTVDLPLEADSENPLRVKMRVAPRNRGLSARTDVKVLEVYGAYALVACRIHTGRQHQIRVHLANLGAPVVGDKLYGPDERLLARAADRELTDDDLNRLELPRQALHAHRYRLPHPFTQQSLDLVSPLPPDLAQFLARIGP